MVAEHVAALLQKEGGADASTVAAALEVPPPVPDAAAVAARLEKWLGSGECFVPLEPAQAAAVAQAAVALPAEVSDEALKDAIAAAAGLAPDGPEVDDLSWSMRTPLDEARRAVATEAHTAALLDALSVAPDRLQPATLLQLEGTLLDLQLAEVAVPSAEAPAQLSLTVTGTPVLHRGLSQSTQDNQRNSLLIALLTVAVVLSVRFRSPLAGLLAAVPTAAALVFIYGGMAALGIRLDIGTSMLASLVIGAGVDYAVHLLSAWEARPEEPPAAGAVRGVARAGAAIWTNALAVALGFFVLTLGDARPLRNVGGLTAAAMVVAAVCTFVLLPLLAGRRRYGPAGDHAEGGDPADPAAEPHVWRTSP